MLYLLTAGFGVRGSKVWAFRVPTAWLNVTDLLHLLGLGCARFVQASDRGSEYPNSRVFGPKIHTLSGFWTLKPLLFGYLDP